MELKDRIKYDLEAHPFDRDPVVLAIAADRIAELEAQLKTAKRDGIMQMMVDLSRERYCFNDRHGIYTDSMLDYANSLTGEE